MFELAHDLHLIAHFDVEDTILHELSLLHLLGRVYCAFELGRHEVHGSKRTLSNLADPIILGPTTPLLCMPAELRLWYRGNSTHGLAEEIGLC